MLGMFAYFLPENTHTRALKHHRLFTLREQRVSSLFKTLQGNNGLWKTISDVTARFWWASISEKRRENGL